MIENMERVVLLSLFTPICDRPLPREVFRGKLTYFYPCTTSIYHSFMSEISHSPRQDCGLDSCGGKTCTPQTV